MTEVSPAELFLQNLPLINRVIVGVCRRSGLRDAEIDDFTSEVMLALMENDYAIMRGYQRRAPIGAFLAVVVRRMLSREWMRLRGRWHASAEAERGGAAAVLFEELTVRDGRSLEEAMAIVGSVDPSLDLRMVRDFAERLPLRSARPRLVPLPADESRIVAADVADSRAKEADVRKISERAARVVREAIAALSLGDRILIRVCFGADLSIADAARTIGVPQRPLYRRMEALLRQLRSALEREGVNAAAVEEIISAAGSDAFDFGLRNEKNDSD